MNKNKDGHVKTHGEKFNLNILKLKNLKSSFSNVKDEVEVEDGVEKIELEESRDSFSEENLEYISTDEALDQYVESSDNIDRDNSRLKIIKKKRLKTDKIKRDGSFLLSGVKTYLPLEYHSAVEVYKGKRKNATLGSGIVNIIKQFFPLKARSDIQLKKFVQVLTKIEIETNNLSALKMKNASKELMPQQEDIIYRLSKDLINLMYLMAYTADDLYEMLPKACHPTLQFSLNLADRKDRELKSSLVNMVTHVN